MKTFTTEDKSFSASAPNLAKYVLKTFKPEDKFLKAARKRLDKCGIPAIHVTPMDGLHLEVLVRALNAKRVIEVGTLGGYSAVSILRGLGSKGHLDTLEINPVFAGLARDTIREAGFNGRATIHIGPALESLKKLAGPYDLMFIDADKENYINYFNWAAEHLRVGGTILADNTFALGNITRTKFANENERRIVSAIRAFNRAVSTHPRFRSTILPTGDGLTVSVKIK
ncbi:MAG: O-methyltransferase [Bdellovibrionia bacterium]